ncbi:MAG: response regulator [Kiritimatiellia bacterium]|jgi:CheY-like chemotaxis protein|nr:response regulator [Kiritimatiellia bacterium]MDP6848521.1 response regulator [Kiritimatiellia bacterium]
MDDSRTQNSSPELPDSSDSPGGKRKAGGRAFIFDDEKEVLELFKYVFESRGYEVIALPDPEGFCSCETCLKDGNTYETCGDVLLVDVKMLSTGGITFVDGLQKKGCRIANIALMSGYWDDTSEERADILGCRIFRKPVLLDDLKAWLAFCEENANPNRRLSESHAGQVDR